MPTSAFLPVVSSHQTTRSSSSLKIPQHAIDSLPMPPHGPPPALADRSTWISSLDAWRRLKNREQDLGLESYSDDHTSEADVSILSEGEYTHSSALDDWPSSSLSRSSSDCEAYFAAHYRAAPRLALNRHSLAAATNRRPSPAPHLSLRTMPAHHHQAGLSPKTLAQPIPSPSSPLTDLVRVCVWDADDEGGYSPDSDSVTECDILSSLDGISSDEGLDGRWEDVRTVASDTDDLPKPDSPSCAAFSPQYSDARASPEPLPERIPSPTPAPAESVQEGFCEPVNSLPASSPAPSPTTEYKKLVGPLSNWVADFIWARCSGGSRACFVDGEQDLHAGLAWRGRVPSVTHTIVSSHSTPSYLADAIQNCLMATLLQPSVVLLGLFYVTSLPTSFEPIDVPDTPRFNFRRVLLGDGLVPPDSHERANLEYYAPFKLFVNGVLLASKMLDDHTFSNKTWHEVSRIQARDINALELHSLEVLRYDLSFRDGSWIQWLLALRAYHLSLPRRLGPIGPLKDSPHGIILRVLDELLAASPQPQPGVHLEPVFLGLRERIRQREVVTIIEEISDTDYDLDDVSIYPPSSLEHSAFPSPRNFDVPPPSDWAPAYDPPLHKQERPLYIAVQAPHRSSVEFAEAVALTAAPYIGHATLAHTAHVNQPVGLPDTQFSAGSGVWMQPSSQVPYHWQFGSISGYVSPQPISSMGGEVSEPCHEYGWMAPAYFACPAVPGSISMPCGVSQHHTSYLSDAPRRSHAWNEVGRTGTKMLLTGY